MEKYKRVLVTGGSGFLGRHVLARLEQDGYQTVIAPRSSEYDLTEQSQVRALLRDSRPDLVLHLAARVGGIKANQENAGLFAYANLVMGAHLIEESRLTGVRKFLTVGTVCAYPKVLPVPFKEDDLWIGYPEETNAPYGLAKKMLLVMSQAFRQQYGFNAIYLLPANLYGPGDNFDLHTSHVIPAMIAKFVAAVEGGQDTVTMWGDGSATREFLYVEDAAEGIIRAAEMYNGAEPVNLGTGKDISIKELAGMVAELTGFKGAIEWDTTNPNGQPTRRLDVSRAEKEFGFRARTRLADGLQKTLNWYLQTDDHSESARRTPEAVRTGSGMREPGA